LLEEDKDAVAAVAADTAAVVADAPVADNAEIFPLILAETQATSETAMTSQI
jgi:hypothetical protein